MITGSFKQLFRARISASDGTPKPRVWVTGREQAALINPDSGRVYAHVWHDGCGKYYPTVTVSVWQAFRLKRHYDAWLVSLLGFPRLTMELPRLKTDTLKSAMQHVEGALNITD